MPSSPLMISIMCGEEDDKEPHPAAYSTIVPDSVTQTEKERRCSYGCERAADIMQQAEKKISQSSAWRIACKLWLMKNDLLSISKYDEVLPPLSGKTAHN